MIELTRPKVFVELGSYFGVSYCGFCQAVKELGLDTQCSAIDTWQGDPQGGVFSDAVLVNLKQHHDPLYSSFSRLIQSDFGKALDSFADGSIDLLHIDGFHTYDAVKHDYETWLPKLSERGVILFHDIAVRQDDFGVWKLWEELEQQYKGRSFAFAHGFGLGVIATGDNYPATLQPFFAASAEESKRIREFFERAGTLLSEIQLLDEQKQNLAKSIDGSRLIRLARRLSQSSAGALVRSLLSPSATKSRSTAT